MNALAEELTGWSIPAVRGQPLDAVFPVRDEGGRSAAGSDRGKADGELLASRAGSLKLLTSRGGRIPPDRSNGRADPRRPGKNDRRGRGVPRRDRATGGRVAARRGRTAQG